MFAFSSISRVAKKKKNRKHMCLISILPEYSVKKQNTTILPTLPKSIIFHVNYHNNIFIYTLYINIQFFLVKINTF